MSDRPSALFLMVGLIAGCVAAPHPNEPEFLAVEVANFRLSATDVAYDMKYGLFEPTTAGMSARVTFENPANRGEPLVVDVPLLEGVLEFNALSPPLRCIGNDHRYTVQAQLIRDGNVLDAVTQVLVFHVPVDLLKSINVGAC
jgi:hypothetical protein